MLVSWNKGPASLQKKPRSRRKHLEYAFDEVNKTIEIAESNKADFVARIGKYQYLIDSAKRSLNLESGN